MHALGFRREGNPFVQYLNIKRHEGSRQDHAVQAALFVCGLPLSFHEADLVQLFSCFGGVQQAVVHPSNRSAIIAFESPAAVEACLSSARQAQLVELPAISDADQSDGTACGLKAWVMAHKAARPGNQQLQVQLDAWTEAHEQEEAERVRAQQAAMGEDGWTVVVRSKGRKRTREEGGVTRQSGGVAVAAAEALAATRQTKPLNNFYMFQRRETRRDALLDLRQQFDEDRKRIQSLRATRNFRPV